MVYCSKNWASPSKYGLMTIEQNSSFFFEFGFTSYLCGFFYDFLSIIVVVQKIDRYTKWDVITTNNQIKKKSPFKNIYRIDYKCKFVKEQTENIKFNGNRIGAFDGSDRYKKIHFLIKKNIESQSNCHSNESKQKRKKERTCQAIYHTTCM